MATPHEKLAESLEVLHVLQAEGRIAIRSQDLSRTHRERLLRSGFLEEVIKGWYVPSRPDETKGESTAWYASFWQFCAAYLESLKGSDWSLSPEQSITIHVENWTVPKQLLVRSVKARNNVTVLPHGTSLLDIKAIVPPVSEQVQKNGLRLFALPGALIACSAEVFRQNPSDMRVALSMIRDASEVLDPLLSGGHSVVAGRLAGAFRNIGRSQVADNILASMRAAGYDVRESDPFAAASPSLLLSRGTSPSVNRIRILWESMRESVIDSFPAPSGLVVDAKAYLKQIEEVYVTDAYHSLSIEGYRVSPELIERVRQGSWNPDLHDTDKQHRDALAARGYWQAFQAVQQSIGRVLQGELAGVVADEDHATWYRQLFAASVEAGICKPSDLAGYRSGSVHIRRSKHVPLSHEAVRDAMPAFFDLLRDEAHPAVRAVLGHFVFVYIHPYMDGNGRIGRFLMNVMLASGGYPWTVIPVEKRADYMAALEAASVQGEIAPFSHLVAKCVGAEVKPIVGY
ncbi:MAG TPA: cell filamentation protein Fic [Opitutae bacterium]|nr:cell filamentation protein Fic [Puniceicoccaceae bacterium]HBR93209.1 cell filamentation protein Fic [Opitutae bacterium]|tara:strand:+ start:320 stop:1861 length:1542 start_codon:yes stop_codon:yes gene_type:complete